MRKNTLTPPFKYLLFAIIGVITLAIILTGESLWYLLAPGIMTAFYIFFSWMYKSGRIR